MNPADFGINGGWGGNRTTSALVNLFDIDLSGLQAGLGPNSTWGLVGDATTNGWGGPDMPLSQTGTANVFETYATLGDGFFKFRENNDWSNNYGDSGLDGTIEPGGDNIPITAGAYKISVDFNTLTYTVQSIGDDRAIFHTDGQNKEIADIPTFTEGYAVAKFKNVDQNGDAGSDTSGNFTDTDFPLFRIADVYLMYAEATLRGGGGSDSEAVGYFNELRMRAGNPVTVSSLNLDMILDERARELYWEGHRRTDLIRYGRFTDGDYVWPWKGGVENGVSTPAHLDLYPIPATDMNANPNLVQNQGY